MENDFFYNCIRIFYENFKVCFFISPSISSHSVKNFDLTERSVAYCFFYNLIGVYFISTNSLTRIFQLLMISACASSSFGHNVEEVTVPV